MVLFEQLDPLKTGHFFGTTAIPSNHVTWQAAVIQQSFLTFFHPKNSKALMMLSQEKNPSIHILVLTIKQAFY